MTAVQKHIGIVTLLLSCAAAQNTARTATVQTVKATREGGDLRVEITLSSPVNPSVDTAVHPDRILLDFPDTICNDNTKNVGVNANGVRRVRTGQHSTSPFVTRVVLDLDQTHPYTMKAEGNRVILTVAPAENARNASHGAPVAATSGNLIGVFRRKREAAPPVVDDNTAYAPPPAPPATAPGPGFEPPSNNSTVASLPPERPMAPAPQSQPVTASPEGSPGQASFEQNQIAVAKPPAAGGVLPATAFPSTDTAVPATAPPSPETKKDESAPNVSTTVAATPVTAAPAAPAPPLASPETKKDESAPNVSTTATATPVTAAPVAPAPPLTSLETKKDESAPDVSTLAVATPVAVTANPARPVATMIARNDDPSLRTVFKVKYVADGVAYLEGGRAQGLTEGMKLEVEETNLPAKQGDSASAADPHAVAELEITAVAETSAVTDIHAPKRPVKAGDLAYLSGGDTDALVQQRALSSTRQYPAVISFTEGDTLDEEAREVVPRPPLPSVNRARGRIGFDSMETISHGTTSMTSSDVGIDFRGDITRIGGTYWNVSGYWRGRLTKASAASQQTLQNLINRTYHLNMTYDNPNSTLVAGFGRLYLPWAPSLDTIDGGYFGKRLSKGTVLGIFGGSTPDPTSWDYSPNRVIGGTFINFEGGEYDGFHYSSTAGAGVSMINWALDRPLVFFEDSISYRRDFAIYESAQLDSPQGNSATPAPGPGLGRNFFTLRVNPLQRVELDFNYNYFRDVPTFDPTLVGTGLLDKFLFQGFSAGGRVEVLKQVWLSTNMGRSSRTGDSQASLNEMYGITFGRVPWLKLRADAHYARFNSSFGTGSYESFTVSRQVSERLRLEVLAGQQNFASTVTANNRARFLTGTAETTLGPHYYVQGSFTTNRGDLNYDQGMFSLGYRFDSKRKGE